MAIYQKRVSIGAFLKKGEDIKDQDIVTIASEGKQVEGQYGMQDIFMIQTADKKEGNIGFNTTSINALIDAYGKDSKNWVGKQTKVWAILSNVQGKMTKVYYFTHPEAGIDDDGNFSVPESIKVKADNQPQTVHENAVVSGIPVAKEEINVDEIPF